MTHDKITLTEEKETLFVPLYSKALESRRSDPILVDKTAESILARVDYDFSKLGVPAQSRVTLAMRAKKLDSYVQDYLAQRPDALVLHLGCGLDSRINRVGRPSVPWYDLDYPDVIELRRHFYQESETYHLLPSSVTDHTWMDVIPTTGPAIIIAEGLLMYLREIEVKSLVLALQQRFPGSELVFDAFSTRTVQSIKRHPSIRKTGAQIRWGVDDPEDIENWGLGIRLLEEWFFTQSEDIPQLGFPFRLMFKLISLIPAARQAHRILRYQL
jgi:O-methyltransferase involved in polyketide biosynthesis